MSAGEIPVMSDAQRRSQRIGYALAVGAAAGVGVTPVASKVVLAHLSVLSFGTVWFACAGVYALLTLVLQGQGRALLLRGRALYVVLAVGVSNAIAGLLYFRAVQTADPALVAFFTRPGTILIVLGGIVVFRERLVRNEWLAVLIVIGGSGLMGYASSQIELHAFALVVGSTVLTSVSYTLAKGAVATVPPLMVVMYRAWATSATFGVICWLTGAWEFPVGPYLWAMPVGAFFGPFLSFTLLYAAFKRMPMSRATVAHAANPIFAALYARLLFGRTLEGPQLLGGLLATLGIALLITQHPTAASAAGDAKAE